MNIPSDLFDKGRNIFGKSQRAERDKKIASAKKAAETFKKLKSKRKKK